MNSRNLTQKWHQISFVDQTRESRHVMSKCISKLVMEQTYITVSWKHAKWQTFQQPENKRQMYNSKAQVVCLFKMSPLGRFLSFVVSWIAL